MTTWYSPEHPCTAQLQLRVKLVLAVPYDPMLASDPIFYVAYDGHMAHLLCTHAQVRVLHGCQGRKGLLTVF